MKKSLIAASVLMSVSMSASAATLRCTGREGLTLTAQVASGTKLASVSLTDAGQTVTYASRVSDATYNPRNPRYANYNRFAIENGDGSITYNVLLPRDLPSMTGQRITGYVYAQNFDAEFEPTTQLSCALR